MKLLPSVVHAEHRGGFHLHVVFNDGSESTIDFDQWIDGRGLRGIAFGEEPDGSRVMYEIVAVGEGFTGRCSRRAARRYF